MRWALTAPFLLAYVRLLLLPLFKLLLLFCLLLLAAAMVVAAVAVVAATAVLVAAAVVVAAGICEAAAAVSVAINKDGNDKNDNANCLRSNLPAFYRTRVLEQLRTQ